MGLSAAAVAAASAAWVWRPDDAEVIQDDEYTILRLPEYFDFDLSVVSFMPAGPLDTAVDAVLERARAFGLPALDWQVLLNSPAGLAAELSARGGRVKIDLDVLAADLSQGAPPLPPPTADLSLRWATDFATARDGATVGVTGFGGELPPDDRVEVVASGDAKSVPAGEGGMVVAYVNDVPAGCGGVTMADGVARLWGGVVVPSRRGQGVYRAVLDARLSYGVTHGATMALVKGNVVTSGPILRKAGFTSFGQEPVYTIPLR
ncbi:N-acetyltransferase [Trebonia kvetii]|uniref:N-acetyltransferase n=1 Tax=Trebonia kvetii TaxID=2480626 RepID=A0A6P2BRF6_9ACTN|nr:GNAT family N-acetyltransferase [Trebonia kvetii]TVZ01031.1 N-acetyltransferase [Trebonia kvetii]